MGRFISPGLSVHGFNQGVPFDRNQGVYYTGINRGPGLEKQEPLTPAACKRLDRSSWGVSGGLNGAGCIPVGLS
jgi:hypothetical protein